MIPAGTVIDEKYEILRILGTGGFGAVYQARQIQFDRLVAIKMLNTTLLQESEGATRFEREARAIDALKHKNIVSLYGYGVWQGAPYMVMELLEGKPLSALIESETKIEPQRAIVLIRQVLEALAAAHAAGIVHRDLKPSNVMVVRQSDQSDVVKIIDFGLVKLMPGYGAQGQKLTETGFALGTCQYMAPEQATGMNVDERADIYGAGCIFYQMLTGKVPFDADNNVAVMFMHINAQPEPLGKVLTPGPLTEALSDFVNICMAKDPNGRYQTCGDAISDLAKIEKGEFGNVRTFTEPRKVWKWKRPMLVWALISACAGVALVMVPFAHRSSGNDIDQYRRAEQQSEYWINQLKAHGTSDAEAYANARKYTLEAFNIVIDPTKQLNIDAYRDPTIFKRMIYVGQEKTMVRFLEEVIQPDFRSPSSDLTLFAYSHMSVWNAERDNFADAEELVRRGVRLSAGKSLPRLKMILRMIDILTVEGKTEEASKALDQVFNPSSDPVSVKHRALESRSRVLLVQGHYEDAIASAKDAATYPPIGRDDDAALMLQLAAHAALKHPKDVDRIIAQLKDTSRLRYGEALLLKFDLGLAKKKLREAGFDEQVQQLSDIDYRELYSPI
jgi:serine/threonine protein kinase